MITKIENKKSYTIETEKEPEIMLEIVKSIIEIEGCVELLRLFHQMETPDGSEK